MKKVFIYSHNHRSESAKALASELGASRIRHEGSRFKGKPSKTVINWGASEVPEEVGKCNILNPPEVVALCSNKLSFFQEVDGQCRTPLWTDDSEVALTWLEGNGRVFARTKTRGSGGDGIVEVEDADQMVRAKLYTKYQPKREEYRVHIMAGKVFLVQRKALSSSFPTEAVNWHIRNYGGGFIFTRNEDHTPNPDVIEQALAAFNAIKGLTFGSVDVIFNEYYNQAYVLEINTASGLQGGTVDDYCKQFKEYLNAEV